MIKVRKNKNWKIKKIQIINAIQKKKKKKKKIHIRKEKN